MRVAQTPKIVSRRDAPGVYVVTNGTYVDDLDMGRRGDVEKVSEKLLEVTVYHFTKKFDGVERDYWLATASWGHGVTGEPRETKAEAMTDAVELLDSRRTEVADWLARIEQRKAREAQEG